MTQSIYLDNHATTPVDARVLEVMLPYFSTKFGNPASVSHTFGSDAREAITAARCSIAQAIGATEKEIIFTSGATESNNLAIFGTAERPRRRGNAIVSVTTEHRSVLDPLQQLGKRGFEIHLAPVIQHGQLNAGLLDTHTFENLLTSNVALVSVMLANNEIGVIQPIAAIGKLCRERGIPFHCDATQAIGKIPVNVQELNVDFLSFTAHKIYGPKGIGALYIRRQPTPARLQTRQFGGGHEFGWRSGTLNVPAIVGFATALEICLQEMPQEATRLTMLRNTLFLQLQKELPDIQLNGPSLSATRLPGNLNCTFGNVDGEALMLSMKKVAVSSGAACSSNNPEPSHVLQALGLSSDLTRASLRFGLGRFTSAEDIAITVEEVVQAVRRLRTLR
jgi:cysteine desulfurase